MADTAVQRRPATNNAFSDPAYSAAISTLEGLGSDNDYAKLKRLQARLE